MLPTNANNQSELTFNNSFINKYIEFTAPNTESPVEFHVWAAINAAGAILARNAWIRFGHGRMYPNTYVILVGPPGARKSTSLSIMRKLLTDNTSVRFGPSDTGGARQGLLSAMTQKAHSELEDADEEEDIDEIANILNGTGDFKGATGFSVMDLDELMSQDVDPRRNNTLYISASEMTSFTGVKQFELINCLSELYDTDNYKYQLKDTKKVIRNPSLGFIAATTPKSLFLSMPDNAIEQGFMSRTVLVYGAKKTKRLAWPIPPDEKQLFEIGQILADVDASIDGEITFTPDAKAACERLYDYEIAITDDRFTHYKERRYGQLLKISMCLAALRQVTEISLEDVVDAHKLLVHTEKKMPDALGHYGLNPISIGKQKMTEYFKENPAKLISDSDLWNHFSRDLTRANYLAVVKTLQDTEIIRLVWAKYEGSTMQVQAYMLAPNAGEMQTARKLVEMTMDEIIQAKEAKKEADGVKKLLGGNK